MNLISLEARIDTINLEIRHLQILNAANYDCDRVKFEGIIKDEIYRLMEEMEDIEFELDGHCNINLN